MGQGLSPDSPHLGGQMKGGALSKGLWSGHRAGLKQRLQMWSKMQGLSVWGGAWEWGGVRARVLGGGAVGGKAGSEKEAGFVEGRG